MSYIGTKAFGLRIPIIKKGDNLSSIIFETLKDAYYASQYKPKEHDIIGITESVVARALGKYITIDDIVKDLEHKYPNRGCVFVYNPIYSRNRFSIILRGIARYFNKVIIVNTDIDEVGNHIEHPITKVNYKDLYKDIIESEGAEFAWRKYVSFSFEDNKQVIDCTLHPEFRNTKIDFPKLTYCLKDICNNISEWGLLGSNKVNEETLKLFPDSKDKEIINELQSLVKEKFLLKNIDVMIYGDGCYKDASSGIWEFADPVVSPAYTDGLNGTPSELKLKYLADDEFGNLKGETLNKAIKERINNKNVVQGNMETQGTTPRKYTDLLGSLMDLISGSGDKGTPVVIVQDYFKNYAMD